MPHMSRTRFARTLPLVYIVAITVMVRRCITAEASSSCEAPVGCQPVGCNETVNVYQKYDDNSSNSNTAGNSAWCYELSNISCGALGPTTFVVMPPIMTSDAPPAGTAAALRSSVRHVYIVIRNVVGVVDVRSTPLEDNETSTTNRNSIVANLTVCVFNLSIMISSGLQRNPPLLSLTAMIVQNVSVQLSNLSTVLLNENSSSSPVPYPTPFADNVRIFDGLIAMIGQELLSDVRVSIRHAVIAPPNAAPDVPPMVRIVSPSSLLAFVSRKQIRRLSVSLRASVVDVVSPTQGTGVVGVIGEDAVSPEEEDLYQNLNDVFVEVDDCRIQWEVHAALQGGGYGGTAFGIDGAYSGVVAVSTRGRVNFYPAVISGVFLRCVNSTVRYWVQGDQRSVAPQSREEETFDGVDGVRVSLFVLNGQRYSNVKHELHNCTVVVYNTIFTGRSASTAVVLLDQFLYVISNLSIDILGAARSQMQNGEPTTAQTSLFQLFSQTPTKPQWSAIYASIVHLSGCTLRNSSINLMQIRSNHFAHSGEVWGLANKTHSALTLFSASAVSSSELRMEASSGITLLGVFIECVMQNGTLLPVLMSDSSGRADSASNALHFAFHTLAVSLVVLDPLETIRDHVRVVVRSSNVLAHISTTISISDASFFPAVGLVVFEVAAVFAVCTARNGVYISVENTTVVVGNITYVKISSENILVLRFSSMLTMQVPILLVRVLLAKQSAMLDTLRALVPEIPSPQELEDMVLARFRNDVSLFVDAQLVVQNCTLLLIEQANHMNISMVFLGAQLQRTSIFVSRCDIIVAASRSSTAVRFAVAIMAVVSHAILSLIDSSITIDRIKLPIMLLQLPSPGLHDAQGTTSVFRISGLDGIVLPEPQFLRSKLELRSSALSAPSSANHQTTGGRGNDVGDAVLISRAWPSNKTVLLNASVVYVAQCTFENFSALFGSADATLQPPSLPAATQWVDGAQLLLGCNMWGGLLFPDSKSSWAPLDGVPRWSRVFNDSGPSAIAGCNPPDKLFSASVTTTSTVSAIPPILPAPVILPAITPNAAILAMAAADGIPLIALGQSACGPPELKKATSSTRYLLSPFFDYGGEVAALGNAGLIVGIVLVHALLAFIFDMHLARRVPGVVHLPERVRRFRRTWVPPLGAVATHFPNLSILAAIFLLNGTGFAAANVLSRGTLVSFSRTEDSLLSMLCGAAGMFIVVGFLGLLWYAECGGNGRWLGGFKFQSYPIRVRQELTVVPSWAVPLGRWGPLELRSSIGKLRGLVRSGRPSERWAMLPAVIALTTNTILGLDGPHEVWCPVQWVLLSVITLFGCAVFVSQRPARVPVVNGILAVQYALQTMIYVMSALLEGSSEDVAEAAIVVLMLFSTLYTLVSIVKVTHVVFTVMWERRRAALMDKLAAAARQCDMRVEHQGNGHRSRVGIGGGALKLRGGRFPDTQTSTMDPLFLKEMEEAPPTPSPPRSVVQRGGYESTTTPTVTTAAAAISKSRLSHSAKQQGSARITTTNVDDAVLSRTRGDVLVDDVAFDAPAATVLSRARHLRNFLPNAQRSPISETAIISVNDVILFHEERTRAKQLLARSEVGSRRECDEVDRIVMLDALLRIVCSASRTASGTIQSADQHVALL